MIPETEERMCRQKMHERHGHTKNGIRSRTYKAWQAMWQRCRRRNARNAHRYVKRGLGICQRWRTFTAFLQDMGECPLGLTLERKNNNLGYSSENCE